MEQNNLYQQRIQGHFWKGKKQRQESFGREDRGDVEDVHEKENEMIVGQLLGIRKKEEMKRPISSQKMSKCNKIFEMITNKRPPSAKIIPSLPKKKHQKAQTPPIDFVNQFQQFFKGFVGEESKQNIRKKSKKKTTKFNPYIKTIETQNSLEDHKNNQEIDDQEQQMFVRKIERKVTYHRRKKQKIQAKIDGLVKGKKDQRKLRKVEMIDKKKNPNVQNILKLKGQCTKSAPKMKIIRSGLPIRLNQVDLRQKSNSRTLVEDHKAKIDRNFYKTLQKNCEVVMSQIQHFQEEPSHLKILSQKPKLKRSKKSTYMKATQTSKAMRHTFLRKSMDDANIQTWNQKYNQIDKNYKKNRKKSQQLSGGLKIFQGYCEYIDTKWQQDKKHLNQILSKTNSNQKRYQSHCIE